MKPNVGELDKKIRIVAGIAIIAAGVFFNPDGEQSVLFL